MTYLQYLDIITRAFSTIDISFISPSIFLGFPDTPPLYPIPIQDPSIEGQTWAPRRPPIFILEVENSWEQQRCSLPYTKLTYPT